MVFGAISLAYRSVRMGTALRRERCGKLKKEKGMQILELAPYGLTGLIAILLVAFCLACKDDSFRSMDDTELSSSEGC